MNRSLKGKASSAALAVLFMFCVAVILATLIMIAAWVINEPTPAGAHVPGCHTTKCDRRIHERRARAWCRRHPSCVWKHRYLRKPQGWRDWAHTTAYCETGGTMNPRIHDPSGTYHGLGQFDLGTWREAGGSGDPHNAPYYEQLTRMIMLAQRVGVGRWPVCGR